MAPIAISVHQKKQWRREEFVYEVTILDEKGRPYRAEFHDGRRFVFSVKRPGSTRGISIHSAKFQALALVALAAVEA